MSIKELRKRLIDKIRKEDNTDRLEFALNLFENQADNSFYDLSDAQKHAINEADEQFGKGEWFSDEEVNKAIDKHFNSKS